MPAFFARFSTSTPRAGAATGGSLSRSPTGSLLALLPFATIAVVLILLLNLLRLGAAFLLPASPATPLQQAMAASLPVVSGIQRPPGASTNVPLKVDLPVLPTNLQFGNAQAAHTLIVLTDPACIPCQLRLAAWLRPLPPDALRIVVKYLPLSPANQTAGLLLELARRHNLAASYWHALGQAAATTGTSALALSDTQLFELLEQQGLALGPLQDELQKNSASLVAALTPDLNAAQGAGLMLPPVLLLDGFVLDGRILQPSHLAVYVQRLQAGESLSQPADALFAP